MQYQRAAHAHSGDHHINSTRLLGLTLVTLLALTLATVIAALLDLGPLNNLVALGIALTKAALIVQIFMGVRFSDGLTKLVVLIGWMWFLMLLGGTLADVMTRGWVLFGK